MKRGFRNFKIKRTCKKSFKQYESYRPYLKEDFHSRCAYCNLLDSSITTPFEVDHFIPVDAFKDNWPECETLYNNLVYSCKKCNVAKGKQYSGDILKKEIQNDYFYNPVQTDYNEIFFRNDSGDICSDDEKGRDMINRLKLYRPIHNLAWICEYLKSTLEKLNNKIDKVGKETESGKIFCKAKSELNDYYILCQEVFIANYNNDKFIIR